MDIISDILIIGALIAGIWLLIKILSAPIRWVGKILLNALLGWVILFVLNLFGAFLNFHLDVTFLNAFIAGAFGVPGVLVLIAIKLFF